MSVPDLETVLLEDVRTLLDRWRREFAGRPAAERERLLLLALEREQIVAVAYREEAVAGRVAALDVGDAARALIRQTLMWIWKDEQLHAEYMRGLLLDAGGLTSSLVVYGRQVQGALSGWTSATATQREAGSAPLRAGAADVLIAVARGLHRMPRALAAELRYQTFRRYCALNVALEASAEFAYRRLVEVAASAEERAAFDRIRGDEARHTAAFRLLTDVLTGDDHLVPGLSARHLAERLAGISPWFLPAAQRAGGAGAAPPRTFGSRAPVVVRSGRGDRDKAAVLERCLDRAGLRDMASGARLAAIRVSFMLGYDRADRSNVNDPELVDILARYLRRHGAGDVAVLEAPTVYGSLFANRSVADGPFGVMGCHRPAQIRHVYAGADALAVDEAVLGDLGVADPRRARIVAQAYHWFGIEPGPVPVVGIRPPLGSQLRGAHSSRLLRWLGAASDPVYVYLSHHGELFVPAMDTAAFPPTGRPGRATRSVRWLSQRAFGLRPPR